MVNSLDLSIVQESPINLNANIVCQSGELLALVGASGSGKTTILKTIAGVYTPKNALVTCNQKIWLDTKNKINIPPHLRFVGMVFQSYALFPHMTVYENIACAMSNIDKSEWQQKIAKLVTMLHLNGLEQRKPCQLSGGQKQRVGIARALARNPQILLLDEPFAAIDKASRYGLYREILNLHQSLLIPIIMVTHDFDEASMLANKMAVIDNGVILQTGSPYEVLAKPINIKTAKILNIKNIFNGKILSHENNYTFVLWNDVILKAKFNKSFILNEKIFFSLPSTEIILNRSDVTTKQENTVNGIIYEIINLSENIMITVKINNSPDLISMTVPAYFTKRNNLSNGSKISVSLLTDAINLMKDENS